MQVKFYFTLYFITQELRNPVREAKNQHGDTRRQ